VLINSRSVRRGFAFETSYAAAQNISHRAGSVGGSPVNPVIVVDAGSDRSVQSSPGAFADLRVSANLALAEWPF
jgi:hypothetical protein